VLHLVFHNELFNCLLFKETWLQCVFISFAFYFCVFAHVKLNSFITVANLFLFISILDVSFLTQTFFLLYHHLSDNRPPVPASKFTHVLRL